MAKTAIILAALITLVACGRKAEDIEKKSQASTYVEQDTSANEALFYAIEASETVLLKEAIKQGADINAYLSNGETALTFALKKKKISLIDEILQARPDLNMPNKDGDYPIHIAIESGERSSAYLLLANKVELNVSNARAQGPLHTAIEANYEQISLELVKAGANLEDSYLATLARKRQMNELAKLLSDIEKLEPQLSKKLAANTIATGNAHLVEYLIRQRSLMSYFDVTNPLTIALAIEDPSIAYRVLRVFLRTEKNINSHFINDALVFAAKNKDSRSLGALLVHGADPNAKDEEGRSALYHAVKNLDVQTVKRLSAFGAVKTYRLNRPNENNPGDENTNEENLQNVCFDLPDTGWWFYRYLSAEEIQRRYEIVNTLSCF